MADLGCIAWRAAQQQLLHPHKQLGIVAVIKATDSLALKELTCMPAA